MPRLSSAASLQIAISVRSKPVIVHLQEEALAQRNASLIADYGIDSTEWAQSGICATNGAVINPVPDQPGIKDATAVEATAQIAGFDHGPIAQRMPMSILQQLCEGFHEHVCNRDSASSNKTEALYPPPPVAGTGFRAPHSNVTEK